MIKKLILKINQISLNFIKHFIKKSTNEVIVLSRIFKYNLIIETTSTLLSLN